MTKKKPARARATARRPSRARQAPATAGEVSISVDGSDVESVYGAAYLMIDRAYVVVEADRKSGLRVTLRPKKDRSAAATASLRAAFDQELEAQKLRWAVARANQPIREYVAENALSLAEEFAKRPAADASAAPAADALTDAQRSEIERLIAEVEGEIKQMNDQRAHQDPKGVSKSWEAARGEAGEKPA